MSNLPPRPLTSLPAAGLAFTVALGLSGCAATGNGYPSLARRPIERISAATPATAPTEAQQPSPLSPTVLDQIVLALSRARDADAKFQQQQAATRKLVDAAHGSAVASEAWAVATTALSALESSRSSAMIALADLDAAYAKARISGEDSTPLAAAREQVVATIAGEDAALADLRNRLAD
ncbi:MAG: hypothetical protein RIQ99_906 [Pseudomonadota bacterium]|jgi:hypothetical protein